MPTPFTQTQILGWSDAESEVRLFSLAGSDWVPWWWEMTPLERRRYRYLNPMLPTQPGEVTICETYETDEGSATGLMAALSSRLNGVFGTEVFDYDDGKTIRENLDIWNLAANTLLS
jgi:hypothetical protein